MTTDLGSRLESRAGWRIGKVLLLSPVIYIITSYLYWPFLKLSVTLLIGPFHFRDQCDIVHGGVPFWMVVVLSPLTFPLHILMSLGNKGLHNMYITWASDMAVEFAPFPGPIMAIGGAVIAAFAISIACVWCTYHILRKRRLSK